jgi:hypothetical protein
MDELLEEARMRELKVTEIPGGWAITRPDNHARLPAEEQWEIDKFLGILDRKG